jgi:hypothetical protein
MLSQRSSVRILCVAALASACGSEVDRSDALGDAGADAGNSTYDAGPKDPSEAACGPHRVTAGRVTPDILVVLDRSASMRNTGVDRWGPSVAGIKAITASTGSVVNYGLLVYPRSDTSMVPGGNGQQTYSCEPGRVEVPIGPNAAPAIASALDAIQPGGATPTAASLEVARNEVLRNFEPDAKARPAYVLLVTDGAPNCTGGSFSGGGGAAALQPEAVNASVAIIADLAANGVKTYVLGYDARSDRTLVDALNTMAKAGGTGDQTFRPVNDQPSLLAEFQRITGQAVSCDYALDGPVDDPTYVSVKLDKLAVPLLKNGATGDGWTLSGNKRVVSLKGKFCDTLLDGKDRELLVDVTCEQIYLE